jgi:hypothetical protein
MGAAFGVALVLIYVLVVWEFGNFRIPLVIMAPIPLTLLGIIPAHLIMFNLGLGGEFTATSMIGWIALAGIIVRNSILLVDFSISQVQQGVPVAEAVIRSCTTRTRPIVITALALVAGASVIVTDPIFQGMAISLSSGVLVSTLLTLIVIPLGCVAASKDLCEVAVASAPQGMVVPCAEDYLRDDQDRPMPSSAKRSSGKSEGVAVKMGRLLMLLFYAVRGLFLLLFDLVKDRIKNRRAAKPAGPLPNALRQAGTEAEADARVEAEADIEVDNRPEPTTVKGNQDGETSPTATQTAQPVTPATTKKATAKKAAAKKTTAKKTTAKKTVAKKAAAKTSTEKEAGAKPQQKAPRRGIRLKTDDSDEGASSS